MAKTYESVPAKTVAFIGLGTMGYPMAGHLAAAGHRVTGYNRNPSRPKKHFVGQKNIKERLPRRPLKPLKMPTSSLPVWVTMMTSEAWCWAKLVPLLA